MLYCLFGLFFVPVWGFGLCILRLLGGILCFLVTHEPFFFLFFSSLLVIIKLKYLIGGFGATVPRQREGVMIAVG